MTFLKLVLFAGYSILVFSINVPEMCSSNQNRTLDYSLFGIYDATEGINADCRKAEEICNGEEAFDIIITMDDDVMFVCCLDGSQTVTRFSIYNTMGVQKREYNACGELPCSYQLNNLPFGYYVVYIYTNGAVYTKLVVHNSSF